MYIKFSYMNLSDESTLLIFRLLYEHLSIIDNVLLSHINGIKI